MNQTPQAAVSSTVGRLVRFWHWARILVVGCASFNIAAHGVGFDLLVVAVLLVCDERSRSESNAGGERHE